VNSSQEFLVALDDMIQNKHINRLIIDLRGNGGGLIDEANRILSYFIPKGTEVVSVKGKVEKFSHSYYTSTKPIYPDLPLIVLVDNNSASAAEILAGALQDFNRATLIGQRTYGKGLVQNIRPIAYGGHLKVTSAKYYLPSGRCIQAIDYSERQKGNKLTKDSTGGILPDIVLSDSSKLDICYNLYRDFMFFDYATQYKYQHPQIASAEEFQLTDEDIEAFCQFLDEKEYTYETETSKYYKELVDMAKEEDLDSTIMAELNALIPKLSVDYRTAIQRNRSEIEKYLGSEIIKRYYYQRGNLLYLLRYDSEVKRALQEITK
jgi:carboxyl-terminal processing protease